MNKQILIVSNNAMSTTRNNGKTIESIFTQLKNVNIAQLYFSKEKHDSECCKNFFSISEMDLIKRKNTINKDEINLEKREIKKTETMRLLRELVWIIFDWKTKALESWLDEIKPDIIFFVGGDSFFAYRIVKYIKKKYKSRLVMYITDDYFLRSYDLNLSYFLRMYCVKKIFKEFLKSSDMVLTIGKEMSEAYKDKWGVISYPIMNLPSNIDIKNSVKSNSILNINYFGGIDLDRWEVLQSIGLAVEEINKEEKFISYKIYSPYIYDEEILSKITFKNDNGYAGSLNKYELEKKLQQTDIVLHVESFKKKNIEKTKLSVSTKISEYQAFGKCIMAVGPSEIASMKYLNQNNGCIAINSLDIEEIKKVLLDLISRNDIIKYYENNSKINFQSLKDQQELSLLKFKEMIYSIGERNGK